MNEVKLYLFIGFCILVELLNMVLSESILNLLVTVPEMLFVFYFILKRDYLNACFFNIVFIALCFNPDFGLAEEDILYSYAKIKLIGPLTISYIIGGIIWLLVRNKYQQIPQNVLLKNFYQVVKYLLLSASILGAVGIVLFSYSILYFFALLVYIANAYIYIDIFLRLYNRQSIKKFYYAAFCLIISSPIATFISYFILGLHGSYSVFDALITNEVYTFVPCLMVAILFKIKLKAIMFVSLLCYICNMIVASRGGYFLISMFAIITIIYLVYFSDLKMRQSTKVKLRIIIPLIVIAIVGYASISLSQEGMSAQKLSQLVSLANLFFQSGDYNFSTETISTSPYIRIGEVVDIVYEGISNPLLLIFGRGYGGFWTDSLNLFAGIDLAQGGFAEDVVQSGKFRTAHSVIPTTLLYNGIIGLFLLFRLGIKYMKRITETPLVFVAGILFFYSFYYDPLLVIVSVFVIFGAEYKFIYA